jgi:spermidine synthase
VSEGRRPDRPVDSPEMEPNTGGLDGDWFYEEDQGSSRFALKVAEHLHSERSDWQKIDVYRSAFHGKVLTLDDLVMLTERDEFVYHEMLVHVPLCAMENPQRVLIIGGGDCGCIREALRHATIERIVQCEIDERVTRICEEQFDWVSATIADPRVELVFDDGVKYIEDHEAEFDLIVIDSTDPIGPAVGLFLADFYRKAAGALRPGGVMAAQTESPFWYPVALGRIHGQLRRAFTHVEHYWGSIPTYPSGSWSWGFASRDRRPGDYFDESRAADIERHTRYWNSGIQRACFQLPNFVRRALEGVDPFTAQ